MAAILRVTVKPTFAQLHEKSKKVQRRTAERKRETLRKLGKEWVELARDEAPERTGKFKKSIGYQTVDLSPEKIELRTYSAQPLGAWITEGTKPHTIRAKNVKFLRFYWERGPKGPGVYFFKSVRHPGTKPNPYTERATRRWKAGALVELRKLGSQFLIDLQSGA